MMILGSEEGLNYYCEEVTRGFNYTIRRLREDTYQNHTQAYTEIQLRLRSDKC